MNLNFTAHHLGRKADLLVKFNRYADSDAIAISLSDAQSGEPYARLTTNISDIEIPDDCVVVKNYSENEGLDLIMVEAGFLRAIPVGSVKGGHVDMPVYQLTKEAYDAAMEATNVTSPKTNKRSM